MLLLSVCTRYGRRVFRVVKNESLQGVKPPCYPFFEDLKYEMCVLFVSRNWRRIIASPTAGFSITFWACCERVFGRYADLVFAAYRSLPVWRGNFYGGDAKAQAM